MAVGCERNAISSWKAKLRLSHFLLTVTTLCLECVSMTRYTYYHI